MNEVGFLKRFLDVAGGRFLTGDLVILLTSRNGFPVGLVERLFFRDDMIEHFVLDLDGPEAVFDVLLGIGSQADDLVAGVKQLLAGSGNDVDRLDAGHLLGGGRVEGLDLGVSIGRAEDGGLEHAGAIDVIAIFGSAGRLVGAVEAIDLGADDTAFFGPGECHGYASLVARPFGLP